MQIQTTTFVDNDVADEDGHSAGLPKLGISMSTNTDVVSFLSRPVHLYDLAIASLSLTAPTVYNPVLDLLATGIMKRKWWNFNLMRATICMKATITTSPYAYGMIILATEYGVVDNTLSSANTKYQVSTRKHVLLDVSTASTVVLKIPYADVYPYWFLHDISTAVNVPKFSVSLLTSILRADSAGTPPGNLGLSAWFEDVELGVPVPYDYTSEMKRGIVSGPASVVASATQTMSSLPLIGRFAKAASIAAGAVSKIASLFGFSKPLDLDPHTTVGFTPSAYAYGADQFRKMTLDPKQGIDPDIGAFEDGEDPLSYRCIVGRWGLIASTTLANTSTAGTEILQIPVTPALTPAAGSQIGPVSPLFFGTLPFEYWRGSLVFRIQVVCSKYHRGRFRIYWTPVEGVATSAPEISGSAYNVEFDLTATTTVEVTVSWGSQFPYLRWKPTTAALPAIVGGTPMNGHLVFQIVEPLQAPNSSSSATILTWVRAGDDFELLSPTTNVINTLSRDGFNGLGYTATAVIPPLQGLSATTAGQLFNAIPVCDQIVQYQSSDASVANTISVTFGDSAYQDVSRYHGGERFNSFRPLCKRMALSRPLQVLVAKDEVVVAAASWHPMEPGLYTNTAGSNYYDYGSTWTYMGWFSLPFRGTRGGVRISAVPMVMDTPGDPARVASVSRDFDKFAAKDSLVVDPATAAAAREYWNIRVRLGTHEWFGYANGQEISYSIPFQQPSQYRLNFRPFNTDLWNVELGSRIHIWPAATSGSGYNSVLMLRYAAGEDWTPVVWIGCPVLNCYFQRADGTAVPPGIADPGGGGGVDPGDVATEPLELRRSLGPATPYDSDPESEDEVQRELEAQRLRERQAKAKRSSAY